MRVCVRVRPLLSHDRSARRAVHVLDGMVVVSDPGESDERQPSEREADIGPIHYRPAGPAAPPSDEEVSAKRRRERRRPREERRYTFDRVFSPEENNAAIYAETTKGLISGVLEGYNATVFAYGNTGAGKTHTMMGNPSEPGIAALTLRDLFTLAGERRCTHRVLVSFVEVYNENIRDLLLSRAGGGSGGPYLDLREDPIRGPVVAGVTQVRARDASDVMACLEAGNRNRTQQATAANSVSSRSHAVLQIVVESRDKAEGIVAKIKIGKLSLVDLAGSERAAVTKNRGKTLAEGANINRSLLALGNCISALASHDRSGRRAMGRFVPYRDSKLTRMLKDSLGGNCHTVMIAAVSASVGSFEETLNTLKYADRAKNIRTSVVRVELSVDHHVSRYVDLIADLRNEIDELKVQLSTSSVENNGTGERDAATEVANTDRESKLSEREDAQDVQRALEQRQEEDRLPEEEVHDDSGDRKGDNKGDDRQEQKSVVSDEFMEEAQAQIVGYFNERMQLRRSLIELEDQNVSNSVEIGRRNLLLAQWNSSCSSNPNDLSQYLAVLNDMPDGSCSINDEPFGTTSSSTCWDEIGIEAPSDQDRPIPPEIRAAWEEVTRLRKATEANNVTKRSISRRLKSVVRHAERFRRDLSQKITGRDFERLTEHQYRIGKLELDNMELEQSSVVQQSIMRGKDLSLQKYKVQVAVYNRIIANQNAVLERFRLNHMLSSKDSLDVVGKKFLTKTVSRSGGNTAIVNNKPVNFEFMNGLSQALDKISVYRRQKQPAAIAVGQTGTNETKSPEDEPNRGGDEKLVVSGCACSS